jgi:hypothetical protein
MSAAGLSKGRLGRMHDETFLRARLFGPDTGFSVPDAKIDRLATGYWSNPATGAFEVYDEAKGSQSTTTRRLVACCRTRASTSVSASCPGPRSRP